MASKFKYQNFMKKKAKEKEQQWKDKMAREGPEPNKSGSYRDKYRSGIRSVVEAK